jgi:hypothetical protein
VPPVRLNSAYTSMTVPTSTTSTKGGRPSAGGQGAGVGLGLAAGAQQAVVKTLGVAAGLELFGLQHEVAAPVAVNAPGAGAAVAVGKVMGRSNM